MITGWEPLGISAVSNFSGWIEAVIVIVAPLLSHAIHWNTLKTSNTSVLFQCIDLRDHSSGIWTVFFSLIFFCLLSFSLFFSSEKGALILLQTSTWLQLGFLFFFLFFSRLEGTCSAVRTTCQLHREWTWCNRFCHVTFLMLLIP